MSLIGQLVALLIPARMRNILALLLVASAVMLDNAKYARRMVNSLF